MLSRFSRLQLFATPRTVARQAPLSMGILQARIPGWVAVSFSRWSSQARDRNRVSCAACSTISQPRCELRYNSRSWADLGFFVVPSVVDQSWTAAVHARRLLWVLISRKQMFLTISNVHPGLGEGWHEGCKCAHVCSKWTRYFFLYHFLKSLLLLFLAMPLKLCGILVTQPDQRQWKHGVLT